MIEQGLDTKMLRVEVYPMKLQLCLYAKVSDEDSYVTQAFSRTATIGIVLRRVQIDFPSCVWL